MSAASQSYRTLLISDLHLGSSRSDVHSLSDFLACSRARTILIVGDAIDFWSLGASAGWPADHVEVLLRLRARIQEGSRVIVIPGNHDALLWSFVGLSLPGLEIHSDFVHHTVKGERYLVVHGHRQDVLFGGSGSWSSVPCAFVERLSRLTRGARSRGGRTERTKAWPRMHRFLTRVARVEAAVIEEARQGGFHGVIAGHTHVPVDRTVDGVRYLNCGDWLRNCTAVAETWSGEMKLLRWERQAPAGEPSAAFGPAWLGMGPSFEPRPAGPGE